MINAFLQYNNSGLETGEQLAFEMGIDHGYTPPNDIDYLIRWGNKDKVNVKVGIKELNNTRALTNCINKKKSLKLMKRAGLPIPAYSSNPNVLTLPILGRILKHSEGLEIKLILQKKDIEYYKSDFYTEYIPKKREYRVHVIDGNVVFISEKVFRGQAYNYKSVCWNNTNGFKFEDVSDKRVKKLREISIKAVKCLGLDFGAVDIIISDDDKPFILEINSSPALNKKHRKIYARELARLIKKNTQNNTICQNILKSALDVKENYLKLCFRLVNKIKMGCAIVVKNVEIYIQDYVINLYLQNIIKNIKKAVKEYLENIIKRIKNVLGKLLIRNTKIIKK